MNFEKQEAIGTTKIDFCNLFMIWQFTFKCIFVHRYVVDSVKNDLRKCEQEQYIVS